MAQTRVQQPLRQVSAIDVVLIAAIALGLALRFSIFMISAASSDASFFGAGSDASAYITLAHHLVEGRGLSFANVLSASRPPLYPMILAMAMRLSPDRWMAIVRALQLCAAVLTALACGAIASKWGGSRKLAIALALYMPTMVFFQSEIITETLAMMLTALWFLMLTFGARGFWKAVVIGILAGLAALLRFNALPFVFFGPGIVAYYLRDWRRAAIILSVGLLVISPWIVRNWRVFGQPLWSTHSGISLAEAAISPLGRSQAGEALALKGQLGWVIQDFESDNAPAWLRDEVARDRDAKRFGLAHWRENVRNVPIKLAAWLFSWEQWSQTTALPLRGRVVRRIGVAAYWCVLGAAILGGYRIRKRIPHVLIYVVFMTAIHLPLNMSTRLRTSLLEPVIICLAAQVKLPFGPAS